MAGNWAVGWPRPPARFRLLYCKMRCVHEANFLASRHRISSGPVPATFLRAQVSHGFRGHRAVRTDGRELAAAPRLRHDRGWGGHTGGPTHAALPCFFDDCLCDYGPDGAGRTIVCNRGTGGGGLVRVPGDRRARCFVGIAETESSKLEAGFHCHAVDCRALSVHRELYGGSADRGVRWIFHRGCACLIDSSNLGCLRRTSVAFQNRLVREACRVDFRSHERLPDWDGNAVSSRDASSAGCGLDGDCFYLAEEAAISFLFPAGGAVCDWLRFAACALGCAECSDAARGAISCA